MRSSLSVISSADSNLITVKNVRITWSPTRKRGPITSGPSSEWAGLSTSLKWFNARSTKRASSALPVLATSCCCRSIHAQATSAQFSMRSRFGPVEKNVSTACSGDSARHSGNIVRNGLLAIAMAPSELKAAPGFGSCCSSIDSTDRRYGCVRSSCRSRSGKLGAKPAATNNAFRFRMERSSACPKRNTIFLPGRDRPVSIKDRCREVVPATIANCC